MGVIVLPWRVWFYADGPRSFMGSWLDEVGASESDRSRLRTLITLYENGGRRSIASAVEDIGDELFALLALGKGGVPLGPIFCFGPFSDTEITFLEGALWKGKTLRPYSAKGAALENLEKLRDRPGRRRREPIGGAA